MVVINILFFIFVVVVYFFTLFFDKTTDFLTRYLMFVLVVSFYFVWIVQIKSVLWLTLACAIGLILNSSVSIIKKFLLVVVSVLFVFFYRVPVLTSDFTDYVYEEYGLYCESVECVQISQSDSAHLQANIKKIEFLDFNSNFFWATGEIQTEDQSIKAANIMGFWFPMNEER
ncbi:hypothetical protein ORD22_06320 [Sporosarcina sp. GW1-11]|uniref:hypothetical protein n=1 Tax=Sporosarcina sp. GW1-11 TaxID=2899126 RepID=UPI00294D4464|nr:hypothetical protein [Sporosarcina sp. GW1-11]MDV6377876.1 hypothetical protein [Sporosarcina sp. GW1-11]